MGEASTMSRREWPDGPSGQAWADSQPASTALAPAVLERVPSLPVLVNKVCVVGCACVQ